MEELDRAALNLLVIDGDAGVFNGRELDNVELSRLRDLLLNSI